MFFMFTPSVVWAWLKDDWKYQFWYKPLIFIKDIPREIKWCWQRINRGWDDREIWSLDVTIAKFILPRLKHLRDNNMGYPSSLSAQVEWNLILDEIIEAFELIQDESYFDMNDYQKKQDKIDKGLQLFAKYYQGLWD